MTEAFISLGRHFTHFNT